MWFGHYLNSSLIEDDSNILPSLMECQNSEESILNGINDINSVKRAGHGELFNITHP